MNIYIILHHYDTIIADSEIEYAFESYADARAKLDYLNENDQLTTYEIVEFELTNRNEIK